MFLVGLFLISSFAFSQSDWKPIDIDRKINNIHSFGEDTVYAGAQNEGKHELYRSTDKGINWEMIYQSKGIYEETEYGALLNIEQYITPNPKYHYMTMWEHEVIRISSDSGKTFINVFFNNDIFDKSFITNIAMYDSMRGIAISSNQNIYTTTDGWKSFDTTVREYSYGYKNSNYFINENEVLLQRYGGLIEAFNILTKKGRVIYDEDENSQEIHDIEEFCIIDDYFIYGAGYESNGVGDQRIDVILKSADFGKSWEKIYYKENEPIFGLKTIDFYDKNNGVAVGFLKILITNDGGKTWKVDDVPTEMGTYEIINSVEWVGKIPIIGTFGGGMYRYEGDYFDFDQKEPEEFYFTRVDESKFCYNTNPFELNIMMPKGGKYKGNGIDNNIFNPRIAGSGKHLLNYFYITEDDLYKDTTITVEVFNEIALPEIEQNTDTLFTQYDVVEWYSSNNRDSALKKSAQLIPESNGVFVARYRDSNLCYSEFSEEFVYNITSIKNINNLNAYIENNHLILHKDIYSITNSIKLFSIEGRMIDSFEPENVINFNHLNSGAYFVIVETMNKNYLIGFIK